MLEHFFFVSTIKCYHHQQELCNCYTNDYIDQAIDNNDDDVDSLNVMMMMMLIFELQ